MSVFVNRTLNMRKVKYIGLDMDHTLVRYHTEQFECLAYGMMIERLMREKGYPEIIKNLRFDFKKTIRGLVIDTIHGDLLKLSRFGAIRKAFHGTTPINFSVQKEKYRSKYIDLGDPNIYAVDTSFSISYATLMAQLVDLKDGVGKTSLPDYQKMAADLLEVLDMAHRDGSLKTAVAKDLGKYIIKDQGLVAGLERFVKHGKKIFILTNSDYHYTKTLLDYAINPFLKNHKSWLDIFEFVITSARKPRFFYDNLNFLKVNPQDGTMTNHDGQIVPGVYQGGCEALFSPSLSAEGDEILYIGDHIYGDILRLKKHCNWRTALVIEELGDEIEKTKKAQTIYDEIHLLMAQKEPLEHEAVNLITQNIDSGVDKNKDKIERLQSELASIDHKLSELIGRAQSYFNADWGEVMRVGNEESYFAYQVERYACIYMAQLGDLLSSSPRNYYRARRRPMSHEL